MSITVSLARKSKDPANLYKTVVEFGTPLQHNSHHTGFYLDFSTSVTAVAYQGCTRCVAWYDETKSSSIGTSTFEMTHVDLWSY